MSISGTLPSAALNAFVTYALVHEMGKRGFALNSIKGDAAHVCVTARFAQDKQAENRFYQALSESLEAVKQLDARVKKGEIKFSGYAPLYCTVADMTTPNMQKLSVSKYLENYLLGEAAIERTVRDYFAAQRNPYPNPDGG